MTSSSFWIRTTVLLVMISLLILLIVKVSNNKKSGEAFGDSDLTYQHMDILDKPHITDQELEVRGVPEPRENPAGVTNAFPMSPELKATYAMANVTDEIPLEVAPYMNNDLEDLVSISGMATDHKVPENPFPSDMVMPEDLLPHDAANSPFSQMNPPCSGSMTDQNFLQPGMNIGIDTKGSTMKNPNYSIRSDYPVAKVDGLIWGNTDWEQDLNRKHFEIGDC